MSEITYRAPKSVKTAATEGLKELDKFDSASDLDMSTIEIAEKVSQSDHLCLADVQQIHSVLSNLDRKSPGFYAGHSDYPNAPRIVFNCLGGREGQSWSNKIVRKAATLTADATSSQEPEQEQESLEDVFLAQKDHYFRASIENFGQCELCGEPRDTLRHTIVEDEDEAEPVTASLQSEVLFFFEPDPVNTNQIANLYRTPDRGESWELFNGSNNGWVKVGKPPRDILPMDSESANHCERMKLPAHPQSINSAEWAIADQDLGGGFSGYLQRRRR